MFHAARRRLFNTSSESITMPERRASKAEKSIPPSSVAGGLEWELQQRQADEAAAKEAARLLQGFKAKSWNGQFEHNVITDLSKNDFLRQLEHIKDILCLEEETVAMLKEIVSDRGQDPKKAILSHIVDKARDDHTSSFGYITAGWVDGLITVTYGVQMLCFKDAISDAVEYDVDKVKMLMDAYVEHEALNIINGRNLVGSDMELFGREQTAIQ